MNFALIMNWFSDISWRNVQSLSIGKRKVRLKCTLLHFLLLLAQLFLFIFGPLHKIFYLKNIFNWDLVIHSDFWIWSLHKFSTLCNNFLSIFLCFEFRISICFWEKRILLWLFYLLWFRYSTCVQRTECLYYFIYLLFEILWLCRALLHDDLNKFP